MIVQRRVVTIHASSSLPVISAAMANAYGTVRPTKPVYKSGGWVIMLASSSSGLRPRPSGGAGEMVSNGLERNPSTPRKNADTMEKIMITHGMVSR
jgi:hypothetical protein